MDLTDEQWQTLRPFFEEHLAAKRGRPCKHPREVVNGILWILRTGAQWKYLPRPYPPYQTCHHWFQRWLKDGKMEKMLTSLARDLYQRGGVDITECFIDGLFVPAKKGALELARLNGARARRSWALQTVIVFLSPYAQTVLSHLAISPMINVIMPPTNEYIISGPNPLPLANLTKKAFVKKGPKRKTTARLMKNIASQWYSKTRVNGITGKMKPLIQGIADIIGLCVYSGLKAVATFW